MTTLLLDGDLLAYRLAASLETKWVNYEGVVFKTATLAKAWCVDNDKTYNPLLLTKHSSVDDEWQVDAKSHLDWRSNSWKYWAKPTDIQMVLGVGDSFRLDVARMMEYKGNRDGNKPKLLNQVRQWLSEQYNTHYSYNGEEGDDLLVKMAIANKYTIVSADKDFWGCPVNVLHLDAVAKPVNCNVFGSIYSTSTGVKGVGRKFFYHQLLFGDTSDNYKPFKLSTTVSKFGEKSVLKYLADCDDDQKCVDAIVAKYKEAYPTQFTFTDWQGIEQTYTWEDCLQEIIDCVYMRRFDGDRLTLDSFLKLEHITRGL